jgi:hypothetical protein
VPLVKSPVRAYLDLYREREGFCSTERTISRDVFHPERQVGILHELFPSVKSRKKVSFASCGSAKLYSALHDTTDVQTSVANEPIHLYHEGYFVNAH